MHMDYDLDKKPRIQNNLKYYREKLGVTQQEMEWRTKVGKNQWSHYETIGREPKVRLAQRFVRVMNQIAVQKGINIKSITIDDLYPPIED